MHAVMLGDLALVGAPEPTQPALVGAGACAVHLEDVFVEGGEGLVLLLAQTAGVAFVLLVHGADVFVELALLSHADGAAREGAGEGLLTGVRADVRVEVHLAREGLVAVGAAQRVGVHAPVRYHVGLAAKGLAAEIALVGLDADVQFGVVVELKGARELASAEAAAVGLLAGVPADVTSERALLRKGLVAVGALVGFLARVCAQVTLVVVAAAVALAAVAALELVRVYLAVHHQRVPLREHPVAGLAPEVSGVCVEVLLQRAFADEFPVAGLAAEGEHAQVQPHVVLQVVLARETLVAHVTDPLIRLAGLCVQGFVGSQQLLVGMLHAAPALKGGAQRFVGVGVDLLHRGRLPAHRPHPQGQA